MCLCCAGVLRWGWGELQEGKGAARQCLNELGMHVRCLVDYKDLPRTITDVAAQGTEPAW